MIRAIYLCLFYFFSLSTITAQCDQPANPGPSCFDALFLCGDQLDGFCSTLPPNDTPAASNPLCGHSFAPNNTEWISFIAGSTNLTLSITVDNCTTGEGLQAGIVYNCYLNYFFEVVCSGEKNLPSPIVLSTNALIPGELHYIWFDGYAGDVCDYSIEVIDGVVASEVPVEARIIGPKKVCPENIMTTYNLSIPVESGQVSWTTTPLVDFTENGATISVEDWLGASSVNICATINDFCGSTIPTMLCQEITVDTIFEIEEGPLLYCPETLGYLYSDGNYYLEGIHRVALSSSMSCDSFAIINVQSVDTSTIVLDTVICADSPLVINGVVYDQPVSDSLILGASAVPGGCAIRIFLTLQVLEVDTELEYAPDSNCSDFVNGGVAVAPVGIISGSTQTTYEWETNNGLICNGVSNDSILLACAPGEYCLTITHQNELGTVACSEVNCISLAEEDLGPQLTLLSAMDSCGLGTGSVTVAITGNDSPYDIIWNDPAAQTTATAQGLYSGSYQVTVTGASACSAVEQIFLAGNDSLLLAIEVVMEVPCKQLPLGSLAANVSGGQPGYAYQWNVPAANQIDNSAINLVGGSYSVTVTDENNCTILDSIILEEPEVIRLDSAQLTPASPGQADGAVTVSITGGTPPYSTTWNIDPVQMDVFTVTGLAAGEYTLTVTDANGCLYTVQITIPTSTAVENPESTVSDFQLYPNPNTGHFYLQSDQITRAHLTIEVYDVFGRKMEIEEQVDNQDSSQSGRIEIIVADPMPGLYLVKILDGEKLVDLMEMLLF